MKVLVLWHVFCITVWACPRPGDRYVDGTISPSPLAVGDWLRLYDLRYLKPLLIVQDYLFTTGAWQYWDMFAPNPAYMDWYGDAIITYKNGTTKVSEYPRMYKTPLPEKYFKERYRKFYERAHDEKDTAYVFSQFAYRQALLNWTEKSNPPVSVALRRHWKTIFAPDKPQEKDYSSYIFFRGVIDPKILESIKDGPL